MRTGVQGCGQVREGTRELTSDGWRSSRICKYVFGGGARAKTPIRVDTAEEEGKGNGERKQTRLFPILL